jgi:ABC-type spermidine/putrescine transport system permease subunit I
MRRVGSPPDSSENRMVQQGQVALLSRRAQPVQLGQMAWAWIGVTPFFVFALMFLIVPTLYLVVGAFQDPAGNFTLANLVQLFTQSSIRSAYWISIKVSLASSSSVDCWGSRWPMPP